MPEADENLVVKLPEMTNHMVREPWLVNTIQSPTSSFPDCEPTLGASDVFEPCLRSVVGPPHEYTVRFPKAAEPQQASIAGSCVTVWFFSSVVKHDRSLTVSLDTGTARRQPEDSRALFGCL